MAEDKAKKLLLIVNPVSGKKMAKRYMMKMINLLKILFLIILITKMQVF